MEDLNGALITLAITAITGIVGLLVWLFKVAPDYLKRIIEVRIKQLETKVDENTTITAKVEKQTNGELARARDTLARITLERDAYRDMVRYVNSTPEGRTILLEYADRRKVRVADAELDALLATAAQTEARP